jgi:Transmembrane secretion effector
VNLARTVGPAIAGVLVARASVAVVFGVNTVSFLVFAIALLWWRPAESGGAARPERFGAAVRAGGRYVRHSPVVRRILLRSALFVVPGSAIWALLALIASSRLHLGAGGYGVLLASLGIGAIAGAFLLPWIRSRLSANGLLLAAGFTFGASLLVVGLVPNTVVVVLALLPAGMSWMTVLSNINAAMQLFLPGWVRARGLSVYQVVFASGQALGALFWGALAGFTSLVTAFVAAGVLMLITAATVKLWPLRNVDGLNREPVSYWPEPHLVLEPAPDAGPILVTTSYAVRPEHHRDFIGAMESVRRSRQRSGAQRWGLFLDGEQPDTFVEVYQVPSWDEHLRQHSDRLTGADQEAERRALQFVDGDPAVSHLLPATAEPLD